MQPLYSTISVKKISKKNSPKNEKKKLHILCIGRDKIGHDFRNFLKLFFEVKKDIKKDARISPDTVVTNTPKFHSRNHFFLSFFGIIIQVFATISIYFKDGFSA